MEIISHRGIWHSIDEQNSIRSIIKSLDSGFGVEFDVRDHNGEIVISHDLPSDESPKLLDLLNLIEGKKNSLAINIKADGILKEIKKLLHNRELNWYVFDMSFPQTLECKKQKMPYYFRISEFEKKNPIFDDAVGIWLDLFRSDWINENNFNKLLNYGKKICIVSSELHDRDPSRLWSFLKPFKNHKKVSLCTDFPSKAEKYFNITSKRND